MFRHPRYLLLTLCLPFFSTNAALSATTSATIKGTSPGLSLDGGATFASSLDDLFLITLPDGSQIDPIITNTVIVTQGERFQDILPVVPADGLAHDLASSSLVSYKDEEDDVPHATAPIVGTLTMTWKDKFNRAISASELSANFTVCNAPYTLDLQASNITVQSAYGDPIDHVYSGITPRTLTVQISTEPSVCYAQPSLADDDDLFDPHIPSMWDPDKGFLAQISVDSNFPKTGSDGLFFDLDIAGNTETLTWAPVTVNGITATMSNSTTTSVRVTLSGPKASAAQKAAALPTPADRFTRPTRITVVGRNPSGVGVVSYGFSLDEWFIPRTIVGEFDDQVAWCNALGNGGVDYTLPSTAQLSNLTTTPYRNYLLRKIGEGLFSEWADVTQYAGSEFAAGPGNTYFVTTRNLPTHHDWIMSDYGTTGGGLVSAHHKKDVACVSL